jgi:hypothetical protein
MSRWNEARGVYEDVCYLRQAHLFQRFELDGFDTTISRDDDHYLASKLKEIGYPDWNDPTMAPCHTLMPASATRAIQYTLPIAMLSLWSLLFACLPQPMEAVDRGFAEQAAGARS